MGKNRVHHSSLEVLHYVDGTFLLVTSHIFFRLNFYVFNFDLLEKVKIESNQISLKDCGDVLQLFFTSLPEDQVSTLRIFSLPPATAKNSELDCDVMVMAKVNVSCIVQQLLSPTGSYCTLGLCRLSYRRELVIRGITLALKRGGAWQIRFV